MTSFFLKRIFLLSSLQSLFLLSSAAHLSATSIGTSPSSVSEKEINHLMHKFNSGGLTFKIYSQALNRQT